MSNGEAEADDVDADFGNGDTCEGAPPSSLVQESVQTLHTRSPPVPLTSTNSNTYKYIYAGSEEEIRESVRTILQKAGFSLLPDSKNIACDKVKGKTLGDIIQPCDSNSSMLPNKPIFMGTQVEKNLRKALGLPMELNATTTLSEASLLIDLIQHLMLQLNKLLKVLKPLIETINPDLVNIS